MSKEKSLVRRFVENFALNSFFSFNVLLAALSVEHEQYIEYTHCWYLVKKNRNDVTINKDMSLSFLLKNYSNKGHNSMSSFERQFVTRLTYIVQGPIYFTRISNELNSSNSYFFVWTQRNQLSIYINIFEVRGVLFKLWFSEMSAISSSGVGFFFYETVDADQWLTLATTIPVLSMLV